MSILHRVDDNTTYEIIDLREVGVWRANEYSDGYQRDLDAKFVQRISRGFDHRLMMTPSVSRRRDGSLWYLDGQHSGSGAISVGKNLQVAKVITGLSIGEEADLFIKIQEQRRSVTPYEKFRARLAKRDPESIAIQQILDDQGYIFVDQKRVSKSNPVTQEGLIRIGAVDATQTAYRVDKGRALSSSLDSIKSAWMNVDIATATKRDFILGFSRFLGAALDEANFDAALFLDKISPFNPLEIAAKSAGIQTRSASIQGPRAIGIVLTEIFNAGRRSRKIEGVS